MSLVERLAAQAVACLILLLAAGSGAAAVRAVGGVGLFHALETSPAAVVGTIAEVARVDVHGFTALLAVERVVPGEAATSVAPAWLRPGATERIAWEELARSRAPRFADGDRVLVALDPLPSASLWTQRFPERAKGVRILAVAAEGNAFVQRPSLAALNIIDHYLRLEPSDRAGTSGVGRLVELVAGAELELSLAAVERLNDIANLDAKLEPGSAAALVRGLLRPDASDQLAGEILDLIERHRLASLRPELERMATAKVAPATVFEALGRVSGELDPVVIERLLEQPAAYRLTAARFAKGPKASAWLTRLSVDDPESEVRAAAVERLVALQGMGAADAALRLLDDREAAVRVAAATALGALGQPAVPELKAACRSHSVDAARAAVAGLRAAGPAGQAALEDVAQTHPEQSVRLLARVALGGRLDAQHQH